jgi:hypothetical protein
MLSGSEGGKEKSMCALLNYLPLVNGLLVAQCLDDK